MVNLLKTWSMMEQVYLVISQGKRDSDFTGQRSIWILRTPFCVAYAHSMSQKTNPDLLTYHHGLIRQKCTSIYPHSFSDVTANLLQTHSTRSFMTLGKSVYFCGSQSPWWLNEYSKVFKLWPYGLQRDFIRNEWHHELWKCENNKMSDKGQGQPTPPL